MTRVFLTGCTGAIGSRLTSNLLDLGYEVFGLRKTSNCSIRHSKHVCRQGDLLNSNSTIGLKETKSEILIHTSWITTPNDFWNSSQNNSWVTSTKRLVNEFIAQGGGYVLVTGSCAEYSWSLNERLNESALENPVTPYGKAKLDLLNWLRNEQIDYLWTRTFFQFGMNEPNGRLVSSLIDSFTDKRKFVVQGPMDIRDFVFVEDVAEILTILLSQNHRGIVNIGTGLETEVSLISKLIAQKFGSPELLCFEPNSRERSYVVADTKKLEELIGSFPWTPLETAIEKTITARKSKSI